jgi:hypothetical protein
MVQQTLSVVSPAKEKQNAKMIFVLIVNYVLCSDHWHNVIAQELIKPEVIPQTTDCEFRRLAQEFAFANIPWLNQTGM